MDSKGRNQVPVLGRQVLDGVVSDPSWVRRSRSPRDQGWAEPNQAFRGRVRTQGREEEVRPGEAAEVESWSEGGC